MVGRMDAQQQFRVADDAYMCYQQPVYLSPFSDSSYYCGWRGIKCQFLSDVLFYNRSYLCLVNISFIVSGSSGFIVGSFKSFTMWSVPCLYFWKWSVFKCC